ncbi:MAG: glycosyltransferase family 2 protein [Candidatus Daviesbacteria bacterium]|nr:glycosyltransferase family 2 protein [Candidatus Daviesbacteria bacterium]
MDLTVIILSYNTKDVTHRCLLKLKEAKNYCEKRQGNKIEITVLDNASADGSAQMIKSQHPQVKLIESKENSGFSKGNNLVMKQVKTPYILLLNSDVYLAEESLNKALSYFKVNKNCDVLGARLNYSTGKLQPSAGNLPNPLNITFWILGISNLPLISQLIGPYHPKHKSFFSKAHPVGWVTGAFFMLRRQVYEEVGGFDENIFMYAEEVEWCKRIESKGFKIWYVPQIEVIHLHGASSQFDPSNQYISELKGIKYFFLKHSSVYFLIRIFLTVGLILRILAFSILGQTKRARVYVEGLRVI